MAATGFTPISLYYSATAAAVPVNTNLVAGELALNTADGKLFYKDSANAVQVIGWKTVPVSAGGTGITSGTSGGVPYYSSTSAIASSALLTQNALMIGGGAGAAPAVLGSLGTTTTVLHGNAAGAPTYGAVSLTADVSGTLPIANGGTGLATTPANGALDIGNGTGFTRATLTAGSGISITNASGSITIAASGSGTVTSVAVSGGTTGLTTSGGPITTSGTITLAGTLAVANGGTGVTTSTGSGNNVLSTSPTLTTPVIDSATISTVSGSAPLAMARAWVSFNGTSGSIYGSFNTSSVTRNSTGNYTVNLTAALPNTTYATVASAAAAGSVNNDVVGISVYCTAAGTNSTPTTTTYRLLTYNTANTNLQDTAFINCVSFA
jgi:hypothetical protein